MQGKIGLFVTNNRTTSSQDSRRNSGEHLNPDLDFRYELWSWPLCSPQRLMHRGNKALQKHHDLLRDAQHENFRLVARLGPSCAQRLRASSVREHRNSRESQGSDSADGSRTSPVLTLHRATELAQQSRQDSPNSSVEVLVHEGEYLLTNTLALTAQDSGSPESWLVFRAADGEKVTLSGASKVERLGLAAEFAEYRDHLPSAAVNTVVVFNVPQAHQDAWSVSTRGEAHDSQPCSIELFAGNQSLPRASFPAAGWSLNSGENSLANHLDHHDGEHAWVHGFPNNDYQDEFMSLSSAVEHQWRDGARYRIENLLCQLDQPGEWYLDCENQRLLWCPTSLMSLRCVLAILRH